MVDQGTNAKQYITMRPKKYIPELGKTAKYRLDKIYSSVSIDSDTKELSYSVIETQTLLNNFFRSYFISCMMGTHTSSGVFYSHSAPILTEHDAIGEAMRVLRPNVYSRGGWSERDEPPWNKPITLIDALQRLSNPAHTFVTSAFSAGYTVFDDIIIVRNYYAHRNKSTESQMFRVLQTYFLPTGTHPNNMLLSVPPSHRSTVIENWYYEILDTLEYMCF